MSAYNVSTVRASKNVQLYRIGSRPRAFQRAIDGVRTLALISQRVVQKANLFFVNKIQVQSNKFSYKVPLCENFLRRVVEPFPYLTVYVGSERNPST